MPSELQIIDALSNPLSVARFMMLKSKMNVMLVVMVLISEQEAKKQSDKSD